jgi:hypothetical protein
MDIAAGNGQAGGPAGVAPDADLIFVHLADRNTGGLANFGDSVRLLEAVDFISRTAGPQPCVINISAGRICGPKDGTTLVERALDELLASTPGRFVANSAGNYFRWRAHSCGILAAGESQTFTLVSNPADITANELEIWYDGADEFAVRIDPPGYTGGRPVCLGERSDLLIGGRIAGRIYHRKHDPNNGDNHIVAFLDPVGRSGHWTITLEARRVRNGRFHAWIERDDSCPGCQARFARDDSNQEITIGSIASSHLPLVVGAYDAHDPARPVAAFSSAGPCRDGRSKPDLAAPGVGVLAARSAPIGASRNPGLLVRGNGTSFATPHVAGAVALCFEAAGNRLSAREIRSLVLGSCDPVPGTDPQSRLGHGYLNIPRLVADTQQALAAQEAAPDAKEPTMDSEDAIMLLAAAPSVVYREYLYRPHGPLAGWIADRYDVVARPGRPIGQGLREGDVLLRVTLGHMNRGRCVTLAAGDLERMASMTALPYGQLLLRPRRQVVMSEPLPVEPSPSEILASSGQPGSMTGPATAGGAGDVALAGPAATAAFPESAGSAGSAESGGGVSRPSADYIRWYQTALNSIDNAGLQVDGAGGTLTRAAVRRFQQRSGLQVDGAVGPDTERALMQHGAPAPPGYTGPPITPPPATATFALLLDADRDGSADGAPGRAAWTWGGSGSGAVVLVNNDDDGAAGRPDNLNATIDGGNDARDVAPLTIARTSAGAPPAGTQVELIVDRRDVLRIFSGRAAGATEIIGPGTAGTFRLPSLAPARFDFAMEAIRYAGTGFSGEVHITLRVTDPGGAHTDSTAVVRVAPWLMPNHLTPAETVFVADFMNATYRSNLRALVTAAGCKLTEIAIPTGDVWMQDCMEFGFAALPGTALRTVLRSPQHRGLMTVAPSLLKTDLGIADVGGHSTNITFNSGGNLECSPPVTSAAGKRYPFGRIYYGPGRGLAEVIDPDLKEFLRLQLVQEPVEVDTRWLTVGHVDEILSFVPAPGPKGFKMIIASSRVAYQILDALNAVNPAAPMLPGRSFPYESHPDSHVEQTVSAFLGLHDDFLPELHDNIAAGRVVHTPKALRAYNADRQRDLDGVKATMKAALGLADPDIVELPSLFMPNPGVPPRADALTAGMVNMLVINRHCIVPKPFGPQGGGPPAEDLFERDVRAKLTPLGLTVNFLDCWDEYHIWLGEVHCSTNTLRTAAPVRWWDFQP